MVKFFEAPMKRFIEEMDALQFDAEPDYVKMRTILWQSIAEWNVFRLSNANLNKKFPLLQQICLWIKMNTTLLAQNVIATIG